MTADCDNQIFYPKINNTSEFQVEKRGNKQLEKISPAKKAVSKMKSYDRHGVKYFKILKSTVKLELRNDHLQITTTCQQQPTF